MAICKVVKGVLGWNVGDQVEASGERLEELLADGSVEVLTPNEKPEEEVNEKKKMTPEELKAFRIENLKKARMAKGGEKI